jgi:RIO-like serine/threonine protein kinase
MIINRNGYGSNFNKLERFQEKVIKKSKNNYGDEKIENELNFYRYILNQHNSFCEYIPHIYKIKEIEHSIEMEFLKEYKPLYLIFPSFTEKEKNECLNNIIEKLNYLHNIHVCIDKNKFKHDLIMETIQKIQIRLKFVLPIIENNTRYNSIEYVNDKKIINLNKIIEIINQNVNNFLNNPNLKYEYGIIHGDCQFNNIMINNDKEIKFIDPRGYYGSSRIYGLIDYDMAKICFALSGYDIFDNSDIKHLDINEDNINVNIDYSNDSFIIQQSNIIKTLMCAIWLGNSHIFLENENKCITSYFIAMYMCSHFLQ